MYVMNNDHEVEVYYYDGSAWETTTSTPKIVWDQTGYPEVGHTCIANMATVAHVAVSTGINEGLFMYIAEDGADFEDGECAGGSFTSGSGSRIYFSELQN